MTLNILHIIPQLSGAGPTRSLLATVKYAAKLNLPQQHRVITLESQAYPLALIRAKQAGITVIRQPTSENLNTEIENADIVQVHFWNHPRLYELLNTDLPPRRLLLWLKILGHHPPQIVTPELLKFADIVVPTTPETLNLPVFENYITPVIPGIADFERLNQMTPSPHRSFNVGYIGTTNFSKMHPQYIPIHAGIDIENLQLIVCGGKNPELEQQAEQLGVVDKFQFRGYVENIKAVLAELDVFGYPLCPETYGTSEKSLQEAMYAGIPPVVFPYGGIRNLVQDGETGLVVNSPKAYQQAITYLYHYPQERQRLGQNARQFIQKQFSPEKAVNQLAMIYEQLQNNPKNQRKLGNFSDIPAQKFISTLGTMGGMFTHSYQHENLDLILAADQRIASASTLLAQGEGGVIQYRNYYPNDCFLRFWSGLILSQRGNKQSAIAEWKAALKLGFPHSRIDDYLATALLTT